jgi:PAS domain S-box-containing protein
MSRLTTLWDRQMIARKLPLSIGLLVFLVTSGMAVLSYIQARGVLLAMSSTRQATVGAQLQQMLEASVAERYVSLAAFARNDTVAQFLARPGSAPSPELRTMLETFARRNTLVRGVEIRDSAGAVRLAVPRQRSELDSADRVLLALAARTGSSVTGPFGRSADSLEYSIAVPLRQAQHLMGFLVERRRILSTSQSVKQLSELIGSGARRVMGSATSNIWTNFSAEVPGPPIGRNFDSGTAQYQLPDGEQVFARALPIRTTPWLVVLEFRKGPVLAPATEFLQRALVIALLLGAAGAGIGYLLSRDITIPLRRVADAASALARGERLARVKSHRSDELGHLANSFNEMAEELDAAQQRQVAAYEQYQLLFERNPMPMWVYDPETLNFLDINDAAIAHYGYSRDEFLGMTLMHVRPPEEAARLAERMGTNHVGGVSGDHWRHLKKDGSVIDVEVTRTNITLRGRAVSFALLHDVTERRAAEHNLTKSNEALRKSQEQLLHSQKMEALGRLAGGVAHDFNNVNTAILGFAELLETSLTPDDPRRADVSEIRRSAMRAAELTKRLLGFSRRQIIELQHMRVNESVLEVERFLRRIIGEDVTFEVALAENLGWIESDPGQFEQALVNLVVNARDAMPSGGKLTIETSRVVLDEEYAAMHADAHPGPHVLVAVSDTGTGMSAETASRAFEPFFTTKKQGEGTGLGLSTVYGIVRKSNGHVALYSELGRGTVFKLYFPEVAAIAERAEVAVDRVPIDALGSETVLLVEDDPSVRSIASRVLSRLGYRVLEASRGSEALEICSSSPLEISLILTDVVMPEMSGPELVEKLQAYVPQARVIFMSGYADDAVVRHGFLPKGALFLQKPFTLQQFTSKIREVLDTVT